VEVLTVRTIPRLAVVIMLMLLFAFLSSGCGSKQASYYILSSTAGLSPVASGSGEITVGVGPVTLPDYLMRPEIVTLSRDNQVERAKFHRWAEPLDETINRVIVEDLKVMLPGAGVLEYPWNHTDRLDYRITIDVIAFERRPDGRVHLKAAWKLLNAGGESIRRDDSEYAVEVIDEYYDDIVKAMNSALAKLTGDLARALSG
jgi:uncharacterized lipoprotein YmbA